MGLKNKKKLVQAKLQKALELELATIPPYLTALFSIHKDANKEAASLIRSVVMEEMLHLTLVANVLTSTGGKVALGRKNLPNYPLKLEFEDGETFMDREFEVDLAPFGKEVINTFMQIELPEWETEEEGLSPRGDLKVEGYTIGQFYESIKKDLLELCEEFGEEEVFNGNLDHQISEENYWNDGGKPIVVKSLKTASAAIEEIIEQGEGAEGSLFEGSKASFGERVEVAHYYRFSEIYHARYYKNDDDPQKPPTGDELVVDYSAVYPIKSNCVSTDFEKGSELWKLNNEFNRHYSLMLAQIEESFNGKPGKLTKAIDDGMNSLNPIADKMIQIPIPGDENGFTGAPSFEWLNTTGYRNWRIIQTVKLNAPAKEVWDLVGGFYTMHTWHPDIAQTNLVPKQTKTHDIKRQLIIPRQPKVVEKLVTYDGENMYYKYMWHKGRWGKKVQNYRSEIRVIETVADKKCIVQWSASFYYSSDALSKFYKRGFKALKKRFGKS
jgi:hypothetical protein